MKSALTAVLLLCAAFLYAAPENVFQIHGNIQLYATPSDSSEVIVTLKEGTPVSFHSPDKNWVRVDFSKTMDVWVAVCFLQKGVYTKDVIFRTAPSAASSALELREPVFGRKDVVIGSDRSGHWRKVRLDVKFSGYLTREEFKESLKKKSAFRVQKMPMMSTAFGRLLPLEKPVGQATYKLVYKVDRAEYLVAYVIPDKVNLKLWENWMIYLSGESIWVPSIYTPFLKGANIFPAHR